MIRPVVLFGSPVLRQKAKPVEEITDEILSLIEDMFETLEVAEGVGLAAPQVNVPLRLFIVNTLAVKGEEQDASMRVRGLRQAFINPEIIEVSQETCVYNEGCLSIPGIREDVRRPARVRLAYTTPDGQQREEEFDGLEARVILHEYDHLEGKLFIDYLPPLRRQLLQKKLREISEGKVDIHYPVLTPSGKVIHPTTEKTPTR